MKLFQNHSSKMKNDKRTCPKFVTAAKEGIRATKCTCCACRRCGLTEDRCGRRSGIGGWLTEHTCCSSTSERASTSTKRAKARSRLGPECSCGSTTVGITERTCVKNKSVVLKREHRITHQILCSCWCLVLYRDYQTLGSLGVVAAGIAAGVDQKHSWIQMLRKS